MTNVSVLDLAYEVLERCVTTTVISDGENKQEEKTYNFEFVDDLYENWAIPSKSGISQLIASVLRQGDYVYLLSDRTIASS